MKMNHLMTQLRRINLKNIITLIVIILFLNLPVVQALEISNVRAEDITENSATIKWETDLPADSFVNYGTDQATSSALGDALPVTNHQIALKNLVAETSYLFKVKSSDQIDDNAGNLYTFNTLTPDTTPPEISVVLPFSTFSSIKGTELDIIGWTEPEAIVNLYLNGILVGNTAAIYTEQTNSAETVSADLSAKETGTATKELPPIAEKYLQSGSQTKITPKIKEIAATITGKDDQEIAENIIQWIKSNLKNKDVDSIAKATLTAEEIIEKGEFSGCTDFALVFITLARAKNIPAIYVETIEEEFLGKVKSGKKIDGSFIGHVFADVYINGKWVAVDPVGGYFTSVDSKCVNNKKFDGLNGCYLRKDQGQQISYLIYDKGLDFWSLGFENKKEFTDKVYTENKALVGSAISYVYSETPYGKAASVENVKVPETLNGKFQFTGIILEKNQANDLKIEAIDSSGNKVTWTGTVYTDASKPQIQLEELPELASENQIKIKGNISEDSSYEIFLNDQSVAKKESTTIIDESISLTEGDNKIRIVAIDSAGWETILEKEIFADTKIPTVSIIIAKGTEFYQGRAVSDVNGETEPGANVYLYVYKPIGYEFQPDFESAWYKVKADQNGSFTFNDVNFESEPLGWENIVSKLSPKEVPAGLEGQVIYPIQAMAEQQSFTYYIFAIAEDASGKSGYDQETLTLKTCYSASWDFNVQSLALLQLPLKLNPDLLDQGREIVTATFNLTYRGSGTAGYDLISGQVIPGKENFRINSVTFERACTPGMMDDPSTKLGCNIFPTSVSSISNQDKTAHFLQVPLHTAEKLSEKKDSYWNEFKKRQIVFPMKIRISYQERQPDGTYLPKTQSSCYDLSYFVDIPLDSKEYIPDFLADEGLRSINWTLNQVTTAIDYVKTAAIISGVTCVGSVTSKMVVRYTRIVVSKLEYWFTRTKAPADQRCPINQNNLYLEKEIDNWKKSEQILDYPAGSNPQSPNSKPKDYTIGDKDFIWSDSEHSLDKLCPMTANMWKVESALDQAYRWTCDRFFCRAVPAAWTSDKTEDEINAVIVSQQRCAVSSLGIPLTKVENCQDLIEKYPAIVMTEDLKFRKAEGSFPCYRYNQDLYVISSKEEKTQIPGAGVLIKMKKIEGFGGVSLEQGLQQNIVAPKVLFAFTPEEDSDQFIIGQDKTCQQICKKKTGYTFDKDNSLLTSFRPLFSEEENPSVMQPEKRGCYQEKIDDSGNIYLAGKDPANSGKEFLLSGNRQDAWYSSDCFIEFKEDGNPVGPKPDQSSTGFLRCVCVGDEKLKPTYGARTASVEKEGQAEDWFYHQAAVFSESKGKYGTNYPKIRYYSGRDFSGAFGANYLIDYLRANNTVAEVNPHTDTLSTFQSVCLRGILARLRMLQSILFGLKNCLEEAKYSGLKDAGVCKTIFAQHVCGLLYKAIALLSQGCSPAGFGDVDKGGVFGDAGVVFESVIGSIPEAMEGSINELTSDYTDASLTQFFATGSQGFAQSMCMAAFGYDFPMGMDFISEALYNFPMASNVFAPVAERELAMFNPSKGTTIYNYNLGAVILPGCRIKTAEVYLKCIGKEDLNHAGVNCDKQQCDCLNTEQSIVPAEKIRHLDQGLNYDIKSGQMLDLHIPTPQKIDSFYRYDHVVVALMLDQSEEANRDKCFDEGYKDGLYYFPITDVSPPSKFICQVDYKTGRYLCPAVLSMFGAGSGAYLEEPFLSCYEKTSQSWADCETPGIFVKGDNIRLRAHVMTDGQKPYCLKTTVMNLGPLPKIWTRPLPENLPGSWTPEFNLGKVDANLFSGATNTLELAYSQSDPSCSNVIEYDYQPGEPMTSSSSYSFTYNQLPGGQYQITLPPGVTAEQYPAGQLPPLTSEEIKSIVFNFNGLRAHNLIGAPMGNSKTCTYQIRNAAGSGFTQNQKSITVKTELFEPDASGYCGDMNNIPVKAPVFGKSYDEKNIVIQLEPYISQTVSRMHQDFIGGNCNQVVQDANQIITRKKSDLEDATALYYAIGCYITTGGNDWQNTQNGPICNYLNIFFNRQYLTGGANAEPYPLEVTGTGEYQKIYQYLTAIQNKTKCEGLAPSSSGSVPPTTTSSTHSSTCGFKDTIPGFASFKPDNWGKYICRVPTSEELTAFNLPANPDKTPQCWARGMYSSQELANQNNLVFGCLNELYCCPPIS